jgi:hypothetical protein
MTARTAPLFAALAMALTPALHAAPVPAGDTAATFKPTLTVRLQPPDQMLSDVRYVATVIARLAPTEKDAKEFVNAADAGLDKLLGADWRKAIDAARPVMGYVTLDANLPASSGAVLVPVKDEAAFRNLLAAVVGKVEEDNGTLRFDLGGLRSPDGKPIMGYARLANQYAYLTVNDPAVIALNHIPTPAQIVAGDPNAVASAKLFFDRVPEQFRQMAVGGVQEFRAMVRGESQGHGMFGVFGIGAAEMLILSGPFLQLYPLAEPAVRDGQELTLNVRFDRKRINISYELTLTARAGSELSKLVGALRPQTSLFPQMAGSDSAARTLIRATIPEDLRKLYLPKIEAALTQMPDGVRPEWAGLMTKVGERLLPTLREGELDFAAALRGPGKDDRYAVVAGLRLKDAAGVEQALRDSVKVFPKELHDLIKLDAATVGGTKVHQIKVPPINDTMKAIFGDQPVLLAFRPDAVLAAYGAGAQEALQSGLTAKPQPAMQYRFDVSGRKLIPLVGMIDADAGKKFKTFLGDDIDRVTLAEMAVEGGSALTVRYGNGLAMLTPLMFFARAVAAPAPVVAPAAVPVRPAVAPLAARR